MVPSMRSSSVIGGLSTVVTTVLIVACGARSSLPVRDGERGEGGSGGESPIEPECAVYESSTALAPLDMFIMLDASGSMSEDTAQGNSKWDAVRAAPEDFTSAPDSSGISVALGFFPINIPGIPTTCNLDADCGAPDTCDFFNICTNTFTGCFDDVDCGGVGGTCVPFGQCTTTPAPCTLDGTLPCDYGFDPLNLGADPENLKWFVQAELMHSRWAMLGLAGMVGPELLTKIGMADLPNWIDAGSWDGYWLGAGPLFFTQMAMMNWAEVRRWQDMKAPGTMNEDPLTGANKGDTNVDVGYPKGLFDPMGYAKDPKKAEQLKRKEIANGRLAMVAMVGCFAQAISTGTGPVDNLFTHLADPGHNNIFG